MLPMSSFKLQDLMRREHEPWCTSHPVSGFASNRPRNCCSMGWCLSDNVFLWISEILEAMYARRLSLRTNNHVLCETGFNNHCRPQKWQWQEFQSVPSHASFLYIYIYIYINMHKIERDRFRALPTKGAQCSRGQAPPKLCQHCHLRLMLTA